MSLAEVRERLQRARAPGLQLEDLLVGAHRPLGRADLVGQGARSQEGELGDARGVGHQRRVPLVELHEIVPPAEVLVMARERRQGRLVRSVDLEDRLAVGGGLAVIEELLLVERGGALEQVDLLPRRGRQLDLALEVPEQLLVAALPVVDAVEALDREEVRGVEREDRLEALGRLLQIVQPILVDLGHLDEELHLVGAAARLGVLLEEPHERPEIPALLGQAREALARGLVARILGEDRGVVVLRLAVVAELRLEDARGLAAQIAPARRRPRGVGAPEERGRVRLPLLRPPVDGGGPRWPARSRGRS